MTTGQLYDLFLEHPDIETDSRKITEGCLFFALKGDKFNGNEFTEQAINKGAAFAVIDDEVYALKERTVLVDNVLEALQKLATYHRNKLGLPIIAITGTNGKTTTKELIAAVLSTRYKVEFTRGNLNNHIGVPLTLLRMNKETEIGVVEMGANHAGEIAALCAICNPDYGIITNIGIAHIEGFGSYEAIKKTKAELYNHLRLKDGLVFYNRDNDVLSELVSGIGTRISYGEKKGDVTGRCISSSPYLEVEINFPQKPFRVKTNLIGSYNFENLMAAACIGNFFHVSPDAVQSALSNYFPLNNRSQLIVRNNLKIVMDAYNANPTSMKASIESFISVFQSPRVLILGDMLELGEISLEAHLSVVETISGTSFDEIFLVGPMFSRAAEKFSFKTFPDSDELSIYLKQHSLKDGAVLIKGSRGIQLEKVLQYL